MRYIVSGSILLATLSWLVLSYLPTVTSSLPKVTFDGQFSQSVLPWLVAVTLAAFIVIQIDLVRATLRWFRPTAEPTTVQAMQEFNLLRGAEIFWTVLPLVGTCMLAIWLIGG